MIGNTREIWLRIRLVNARHPRMEFADNQCTLKWDRIIQIGRSLCIELMDMRPTYPADAAQMTVYKLERQTTNHGRLACSPGQILKIGHAEEVDARCHHQPEPQIVPVVYLMCSRRGAVQYTLACDECWLMRRTHHLDDSHLDVNSPTYRQGGWCVRV